MVVSYWNSIIYFLERTSCFSGFWQVLLFFTSLWVNRFWWNFLHSSIDLWDTYWLLVTAIRFLKMKCGFSKNFFNAALNMISFSLQSKMEALEKTFFCSEHAWKGYRLLRTGISLLKKNSSRQNLLQSNFGLDNVSFSLCLRKLLGGTILLIEWQWMEEWESWGWRREGECML